MGIRHQGSRGTTSDKRFRLHLSHRLCNSRLWLWHCLLLLNAHLRRFNYWLLSLNAHFGQLIRSAKGFQAGGCCLSLGT